MRPNSAILKIDDTILTPAELAGFLKISRGQAYGLCASGKIAAKNVGLHPQRKCWRIPLSAVIAFLETPDNPDTVPPVPKINRLPPHIPNMVDD